MFLDNHPKGAHMYKNTTKEFMIVFVVLTLAGGVVVQALAAVSSEPKVISASQFTGDYGICGFFFDVLVSNFRYQKSNVVFIGDHLESADDNAERACKSIAELEQERKDFSILTEAMADFEVLYALAQADHQAALALVDAQAGLSPIHRVTDLADAREIAKAVKPSLFSSRENIVGAMQTIHIALQDYQDIISS